MAKREWQRHVGGAGATSCNQRVRTALCCYASSYTFYRRGAGDAAARGEASVTGGEMLARRRRAEEAGRCGMRTGACSEQKTAKRTARERKQMTDRASR